MKTLKFTAFVATATCFILLAFINLKLGAITGKIIPVDGAKEAIIIRGQDTLKANINAGQFKFDKLQQGIYNIQIIANEPYRNYLIENVAVKDSSTTNLGQIKLLQ